MSDEITKIKYIGVVLAKQLQAHGFNTVEAIAEATPDRLIQVSGISHNNVQRIIEAANDLKATLVLPSIIEPPVTKPEKKTTKKGKNKKPSTPSTDKKSTKKKTEKKDKKEKKATPKKKKHKKDKKSTQQDTAVLVDIKSKKRKKKHKKA